MTTNIFKFRLCLRIQSYACLLLSICAFVSYTCRIFAIERKSEFSWKKKTAIPHELPPEAENHSFFFIDQRVETGIEGWKLHRHDAWELYYVVHGYGSRTAGDTCQPFYASRRRSVDTSVHASPVGVCAESADTDGRIRYLMAAFDHSLVKRCMEAFPEVRNRLGHPFPRPMR